jgi:hypothetical protein
MFCSCFSHQPSGVHLCLAHLVCAASVPAT